MFMYIIWNSRSTIIWYYIGKKGGKIMGVILSRISGVLAFVMFLSFGTSAFASNEKNIGLGSDLDVTLEEVTDGVPFNKIFANFGEENALEDVVVEEYVDEEGRINKMVIETEEDRTVVSLFVDGKLEQQSIVDKETGELTGFSEYGENEFAKNIDDFINVEDTLAEENDMMMSPMAVGYYSQVASRVTVPNAMCNKKVTAYLYQKSTITNTAKMHISFSKREVITAILAAIVSAVILKSKPSVTLLKEMLISIGVGVAAGALSAGFEGHYQVKKDIKDYYATISGTKYFTNKITKEYMTLYNKRNGKAETKYLGQTVSAYGKPTSHQVMLSQAIVTWSKGTKCK